MSREAWKRREEKVCILLIGNASTVVHPSMPVHGVPCPRCPALREPVVACHASLGGKQKTEPKKSFSTCVKFF